jgi:hypothetical protein
VVVQILATKDRNWIGARSLIDEEVGAARLDTRML